MRVVIVGRGRVGRGLHASLEEADVEVGLTPGSAPRPRNLAAADVVLLATPDPSLPAVAAIVSPLAPRAVLLHCSGSLDAEILAPHAPRGVMHPLASFASPERPPTLAGTTFMIAGDSAARRAASRLAHALGARPSIAEVHGPGYHAAAALSANGAAGLAMIAVAVLEAEGLGRREAERALGALLRTVGENIEHVGLPDALSGPVVRGDAETVRRHRAALEALDPAAREAYDAVAPAILECARRAGLPDAKAEEIEALIAQESSE